MSGRSGMIPLPKGGIRVTVQRTTTDRYGDRTYTDHHVIDGCLEFPSFSTSGRVSLRAERTDASGTDVLTDSRTLYAPPNSDILSTDRVIIHPAGLDAIPPDTDPQGKLLRRENAYDVMGRPMEWKHMLTGWDPGMEIALVRVS